MSNEIKGVGNSYTAEFWEYDSKLGRRWNLDPVPKATMSNYAAFSNSPIRRTDPHGDSDSDFQTPAGGSVRLPEQAKSIHLFTGTQDPKNWTWSNPKNIPSTEALNKLAPQGTLSSFEADGKLYEAIFGTSCNGCSDWSFQGYKSGSEPYREPSLQEKAYQALAGPTGTSTMLGLVGTVGSADIRMAKLLDAKMAYEVGTNAKYPFPNFRAPVGPTTLSKSLNLRIPTSSAKLLSTTLKTAGYGLGALGIGVSIYEIRTGRKNVIGEGGLDIVFGVVGFLGPVGFGVSLAYNVGKFALQQTGNDFWNKK